MVRLHQRMQTLAASTFLGVATWFAGCSPETGPADDLVEAGAEALIEGALLAAHDASCLQLQDQNTWDGSVANVAGVGPAVGLAGVLADLNRVGPVLAGLNRPAAVGFKGGFRWSDGDMGTDEWVPQALTAGVSGGVGRRGGSTSARPCGRAGRWPTR